MTLTIGLIQDLSSPNVTVGYLVADYEMWNLQYATLTDKAADDFATIPALAESWEGSEDGLTWTYTLAGGTARGPTASRSPPRTSPTRSTVRATRSGTNHYSTVQNLEATALDERTLEIVTSVPDPKLPTMDVYIVPKHIYESISADDLLVLRRRSTASHPGSTRSRSGGRGRTGRWSRTPTGTAATTASIASSSACFTNADAMVAAIQRGEIDVAHDFPPARSSNSRPTRTSRSSTASRAASPSWR